MTQNAKKNQYEKEMLKQGKSELWYYLASRLAFLKRHADNQKLPLHPTERASLLGEIATFNRFRNYLNELEKEVSDS